MSEKIAEVIEASSAQWVAQSYELYALPPLGGLVRAGDIYAIVCHAATGGIEPGRKAIARGRDEPSEDAIYKSSPQLTRLLRSEFIAMVVGYKNGDKISQYLPPQPVRIHSFVYLCPPDEVREFSRAYAFLNILANAALPVLPEEIIAAALRQMAAAQDDGRAFLVAAGKELANLLSTDFTRLKSILEKIAG